MKLEVYKLSTCSLSFLFRMDYGDGIPRLYSVSPSAYACHPLRVPYCFEDNAMFCPLEEGRTNFLHGRKNSHIEEGGKVSDTPTTVQRILYYFMKKRENTHLLPLVSNVTFNDVTF